MFLPAGSDGPSSLVRRLGIWRAGLLAIATATTLHAQSIDLQLRDSSSRAPITGAIVRLLGVSGVVSQGLTNEQGRILLQASGAGRYRIKVDRIGQSGTLTPPFELSLGETLARVLMLAPTPIELPALVVTGRSACKLDQAGALTALLWEEIRKALTANVLTQRQGRLPLHVREFKRELTLSGQLLREWVTSSTVVRGRPFGALPPAVLAKAGFVQTWADSILYAAPDADLLLSDEFVETHCFRVVPVVNGLVGLEFVPAPRRKVSDVRGTLWVDRAGGNLKFLEYTYTGVEPLLGHVGLGGRVEFTRLPSGAWIVSSWYTRMPRFAPPKSRGEVTLAGLLDRGGKAELAVGTAGSMNRAIVSGRIYDSVAARGLADAMVRVAGYPDSVTTDEEGRFELALQLSGDQVVTATHSKLGLLQDRPIKPVLLSIGDTTRVDLAVPSVATFVRTFCGPPRGGAGLVGLVLRSDGTPAARVDLRVTWLTSDGIREERARSGTRGAFALCNLPPGPTLPVRLQDGLRLLLEHRLTLEPREYRWIELTLPPPEPH